MPFTITIASRSDAAAIARVFQSNETDSFLRLQLGTVDPEVLKQGLTERLAANISKPHTVYVVARDDATGEIVSFASWTLPRGRDEEFVRQSEEVSLAAAAAAAPLVLFQPVRGYRSSLAGWSRCSFMKYRHPSTK